MERIVVFKNSNVECVLIVLPPGYMGDTHDHPGVYCTFKILQGEMIEHREGRDSTNYKSGEEGEIWDDLGTHRVCAPGGSTSIHLHSKL